MRKDKMFKIEETVTRELKLTPSEFSDGLLKGTKKSDVAFRILSELVKKHRFELFRTHEAYRIITNGFGQFKHIGVGSYGSLPVLYSATYVIDKLYSITQGDL